MKNNKIKISIFSVALLSLFAVGNAVLADSVTGTLNTGLNATNGTTVTGVVISSPAITPLPGTYTSAQNVTLSAAGSTSVHYTLNGDSVSCATGSVYSTPISFSTDTLILAISCYPNGVSSPVASFAYVISAPQVQNR